MSPAPVPAPARRLISIAAIGALAASLTSCGGSGSTTSSQSVTHPVATITTATLQPTATPATGPSGAAAGSAGSAGSAGLTVANAWAKAVPDLATGRMTGVFATLTNTTDTPIVLVSAATTLASMTELHETVLKDGSMVMQRATGGFTVAAHQTRQLKPGGDHIMLMNLAGPLKVGASVEVTLRSADGATIPLTAVAKDFTMGNEPYATAARS